MVQRQVLLGLGTNYEPRAQHLARAIRHIQSGEVLSGVMLSPIYESPAMLPPGAPPDWNMPYLNMVIKASTSYAPHRLLDWTQAIEVQLGRIDRGRWGPREIDVDILDIEGLRISDERLNLPHAHMLQRDFVMIPLADLLPEWRHPLDESRQSAAEYAEHLRAGSRIRPWGDTLEQQP
jgi:2-amino-4-hydroxy-6-hydroxymethyldihydropteridine diphosphokinase